MSGKYEKKESRKKRGRKLPWIIGVLLAVTLVVFLAAYLAPGETEEPTEPSVTVAESQPETLPEETKPREEYLFSVDSNIKIKEISSYTGPYMEDGSDDAVENVMQILVKNIGQEPLQYAKIVLISDGEEAVFEMTTLYPGESMAVLEADRKTCSEDTVYTSVRAENIAYFQYVPSNYEDKLWIQPLDGGFNIKNVSDEDIVGKIVIYFKNYTADRYAGGITYSGTIKNGLKAGEIRQVMSSHFSASDTRVVFVTIG